MLLKRETSVGLVPRISFFIRDRWFFESNKFLDVPYVLQSLFDREKYVKLKRPAIFKPILIEILTAAVQNTNFFYFQI